MGAAQSFDQTALKPSVIKRICHIDVKYILHPTHVVDVRKGIRSKNAARNSQYSSLTPLERECYEGEVQPYRKTDYKPIIYMHRYIMLGLTSLVIHLLSFCQFSSSISQPSFGIMQYGLIYCIRHYLAYMF